MPAFKPSKGVDRAGGIQTRHNRTNRATRRFMGGLLEIFCIISSVPAEGPVPEVRGGGAFRAINGQNRPMRAEESTLFSREDGQEKFFAMYIPQFILAG